MEGIKGNCFTNRKWFLGNIDTKIIIRIINNTNYLQKICVITRITVLFT